MSPLTDKLGVELPIIQAPMAGVQGERLAAAVSLAGGLGSIPCAMLSAQQISQSVSDLRAKTDRPYNLNFFCHQPPQKDDRVQKYSDALAPYYAELGLDSASQPAGPARQPFNEELADVTERLQPPVVSFHFGLPEEALLNRVKQAGALVLSSATTIEEAEWLASRGVDAVIAQGLEAGGHRGHFLKHDLSLQSAAVDLVKGVVRAVQCPVIAAGGLSQPEHVTRMMDLGAQAVQIGTAYLLCPEADTSQIHRSVLSDAAAETAVTNLFTGRPARGLLNRLMRELGPLNDNVPEFPLAASMVTPLRQQAEQNNSGDFSPLWAGTRYADCLSISAAEVTRSMVGAG